MCREVMVAHQQQKSEAGAGKPTLVCDRSYITVLRQMALLRVGYLTCGGSVIYTVQPNSHVIACMTLLSTPPPPSHQKPHDDAPNT
jgi:hypothetical protein